MKSVLTVLHALWMGAHLSVGYVVAPLLFAYADDGLLSKQTAGNMAGDLFDIVMYFGMFVCVVWWLYLRQQRLPKRLLQTLLALLGISQWLITPIIVALKQQQSHWLLNWVGGSFGMWHGVSAVFYLLISILLLIFTWQRLTAKSRY